MNNNNYDQGYSGMGMNGGAPEYDPRATSRSNSYDYSNEYEGYAGYTGGGIGMGADKGVQSYGENNGYSCYDDGTNVPIVEEGGVPLGTYYQFMAPYQPHIQSSPISSIAIDPLSDALFVTGHSIVLSRKRHYGGYSSPASSTDQRVSMLATHAFSDASLYSACAAHAEAKKDVLDNVATAIFGNAFKNPSGGKTQMKIPTHAYRTPYQPVLLDPAQSLPFPNKSHHLGITKILPFSSKVASSNENVGERTEGYMCTVSPSAVRVHTHGGMQLSESKITGMIAGTFHPGGTYVGGMDEKMVSSSATHVTVGGISTNRNGYNLHCMDLYSSSLKAVASHNVRSTSDCSPKMCISDLATSHETTNIIAGCSDGTLRIFDGSWRGGNYMECAKVNAHGGGVAHVACAGNLICTTGYSSRIPVNYSAGSSLCAFPDEHVLVFDVRYLGRGGIAHPFSGLKGGPRFISFLPGLEGSESEHRILVASGQAGGGLQIITPFASLSTQTSGINDYFNPQMEPTESMTAMSAVGRYMAIGTNFGNIHQYCMAKYNHVIASKTPGTTTGQMRSSAASFSPTSGLKAENTVEEQKEVLHAPSFLEPPALSLEPHLLQGSVSHDAPSISIFNLYIMCNDPILTPTALDGNENPYSFGPLSTNTFRPSGKRVLSKELQKLVSVEKDDDFLTTIQASMLDLNLLAQSKTTDTANHNHIKRNANKLLHADKFAQICYDTKADPRKKGSKSQGRDGIDRGLVPERYKNKDRPPNSMFTIFDFAALNDTLFPGCDYPPAMKNSNVSSVLLLLYFVPEIQNAMLACQHRGVRIIDNRGKKQNKVLNDAPFLSAELGFLFHQMNSISINAMSHPKPAGTKEDPCRLVLGTFVPSNFLSSFITMPEASALALLDDSVAAAELARRPEAFYRFLLHHLDRETSTANEASSRNGKNSKQNSKNNSKALKANFIDSLQGMSAVSMNEFVTGSGPPSVNSTRSYTVDLSYDAFINRADEQVVAPEFGQVLQYSLCKYVRLRAWCDTTQSYETVVQRKIVTSLPKIMSLCCSCAGIHGEDRLPLWRKTSDDNRHWLPEMVEIEIEENGNVITRQMAKKEVKGETAIDEWVEFKGNGLPKSVTDVLHDVSSGYIEEGRQCARYRLDIVLTYLNDEANDGGEQTSGRHIVHSRVPKCYKKQILTQQLENVKRISSDTDRVDKLTLLRNVTSANFDKRAEAIQRQIEKLDKDEGEDEWVLFNGPNVSSTSIDDAQAFHVPFKEPCILVYRQVDCESETTVDSNINIPDIVWTDSHLRPDIPSEGDILAFDAEFVLVENESSQLTASGSKVVIREGRLAIGRMSLLDCKTGKVLIDDHVIPREPVVDFLTRFSGITASDLNPKTSRHTLITARTAYLKMRYLVDKGCKFVGHGLRQDFLTVNLFVPPCQLIDTVDIYRMENRRYISLRFLVNYLLGRDMQQEIHDSIEDARAAYELYLKALELKKEGIFDEVLRKIYERGQQIDWKVAELKRPDIQNQAFRENFSRAQTRAHYTNTDM